MVKPEVKEEIKPVINYYLRNKSPDDSLFVYFKALNAFKFYTRDKDISERYNSGEFVNYLNQLDRMKNKKVWFIFSHISDLEKDIYLNILDNKGLRVHSFLAPGAFVYCYEMQ